MGRGRPLGVRNKGRKFDDAKLKRALELDAKGVPKQAIAMRLGVSVWTIYNELRIAKRN